MTDSSVVFYRPDGVAITYRGWAGHYILSRECLFRLNTLVEYEGDRRVVSTVGMLAQHLQGKDSDQTCYYPLDGVGSYFELKVFRARKVRAGAEFVWDANPAKEDCEIDVGKQNWDRLDNEVEVNRRHTEVVHLVGDYLVRTRKR